MPCNTAIARRLLVVAAVVAALSATLCGCNKDDSGLLEVFAESFGSDTKLVVNNRIASWQDGDEIRINGTTAAIRRQLSQGDTHAYIPSTAASAVNRAVFPASLCSSITGDNITITLPSEYRYRTARGLQVLEVPMAAASAEESPLHFRHLTGALNIRIQGRYEPVILESVTISSDKYQLSGCWPLNFADIAGQTAREATSDEQKSVSLKFDGTELPANDSLDVIIPVPPVGSDNHFTVVVKARHEGTRFVYTRSQTGDADRSLGRNVMGYVEASMSSSYVLHKLLFNGQGTSNEPLQINSKEDFLLFVDAINNDWSYAGYNKYNEFCFLLQDSIDMTGDTISPISNFTHGGTFDGGSKPIKNVIIISTNTQSSTYECGLFASPKATIKNLILDNVKLQHSGNTTTLLVSPLCTKTSNCTILNCTIGDVEVDAQGTISGLYYGGLSALVTTNLNVSNCSINGNVILPQVSGDLFFGGLISQISAPDIGGSLDVFNVIISNCTIDNHQLGLNSNGRICFGGMIGTQSTADVSFSNCKWNGIVTIDAQNTYAGGLSASYNCNSPGTNLSFSISNFTGSITASITGRSSYLGRFIGKKSGSGHYTNDTSTSTIVLTLNGDTINKDIGNQ